MIVTPWPKAFQMCAVCGYSPPRKNDPGYVDCLHKNLVWCFSDNMHGPYCSIHCHDKAQLNAILNAHEAIRLEGTKNLEKQ